MTLWREAAGDPMDSRARGFLTGFGRAGVSASRPSQWWAWVASRLLVWLRPAAKGPAAAASTAAPYAPGLAAADDPLLETISGLTSSDAVVVRSALASTQTMHPRLVPYLIPLLARSDLALGSVPAFQRAVSWMTDELVDALLDPGQPLAMRQGIPPLLADYPTQRHAEGLLLGLRDESFDLRRTCALALAGMTARSSSLLIPAEPVLLAAMVELEQEPPEGAAAEEHLEYVVDLLSLVLDRQSLQSASWGLRSHLRWRGSARESLSTALPENARQALRAALGPAALRDGGSAAAA